LRFDAPAALDERVRLAAERRTNPVPLSLPYDFPVM
jgi:hypothetical protein